MTRLNVSELNRIGRATRRVDREAEKLPDLPRAGRGTAPAPYRDVTVYVWHMGGNPGGRDAQGNIIPTTLTYRFEWPNEQGVLTRVDAQGVYDPTALYRLSSSAPMQPHMQLRIPGVGYAPAVDRSIGDGFHNENGDFILKRVLEIPIFTEACQ